MAKILNFPEKRRRHERVMISQPVALVHENATVATSTAINISQGGLQALCDRYTMDSLHPSATRPGRHRSPRIDVHFRLPTNAGSAKLDIECRIAYVVQSEDSELSVGLEFVRVYEESRNVLDSFLQEAREMTAQMAN